MSLHETIEMGLQGVQHFRTAKAAEYPDDRRNSAAVAIAARLLATPAQISAETLGRFNAADDALTALGSDDFSLTEAESDLFRRIGFWSQPKSWEEIAIELCEIRESTLANYRPEEN